MLTQESRSVLLAMARRALESFTGGRPPDYPDLTAVPSDMRQPGGVFVTLRVEGALRGCVGNLDEARPLAHEVIHTAIASASQDPRFGPLTLEELLTVQIEISVLSPLRRVRGADEISPPQHGVMVVRGRRKGLFLPQVWEETGWVKDRFLTELCQSKAGLPGDAWKDPETELFVFDVESFG